MPNTQTIRWSTITIQHRQTRRTNPRTIYRIWSLYVDDMPL